MNFVSHQFEIPLTAMKCYEKKQSAHFTLHLLKTLMAGEKLIDFFVGGTTLALQIGHRISIDLDLFSRNSFSAINPNANVTAFIK